VKTTKTVKEYLIEHAVLDCSDKRKLDGFWVPLSVAQIAVIQALKGNLKLGEDNET